MYDQTKHSQLKKSCDQLQLGWVQATFMITMLFIHSWGDWQLQFQRYDADPDQTPARQIF